MLTEDEIENIVARIATNHNPERIILFGSYAYGTPTEDSDLDLLVVVRDSEQPRYKRAREIRKHLWGIVEVPKDILVYTQKEVDEWKGVEEALITSIMKTGKVVYENKEGIHQ